MNNLGKRTGVDWSKHELAIDEYRSGKFGFLIHILKVPDSRFGMVVFTNIFSEFDNQLLVTGDYSDWIFCRAFTPSPNESVDDNYWLEKLSISNYNIQYKHYDSELTVASLKKEMKRVIEDEEFYYGEKEKTEYLDYLKDCIIEADDEISYTYQAYRNMPVWLDNGSVIMEYSMDIHLKVVFDAFEEICRRLKEQEKTKKVDGYIEDPNSPWNLKKSEDG